MILKPKCTSIQSTHIPFSVMKFVFSTSSNNVLFESQSKHCVRLSYRWPRTESFLSNLICFIHIKRQTVVEIWWNTFHDVLWPRWHFERFQNKCGVLFTYLIVWLMINPKNSVIPLSGLLLKHQMYILDVISHQIGNSYKQWNMDFWIWDGIKWRVTWERANKYNSDVATFYA